MGNPGESKTYWQPLAVAADEGDLYLNAEAAALCSAACDDYIAKLKKHQRKALDLADLSGWGEFASGKQLQQIYAAKASGGEDNMVDVLQSHIDVVEEMQAVFNKFFLATENVDDANAADVRAQGSK